MTSAPTGATRPVTQTHAFWVLIGYAVALGTLGAFASLVFLGVTGVGDNWYDDTDPGWFGGHWWWIAVTAAAGVLVGLLRRMTHLPEHPPGLIDDLKDEHVDPRLVPGVVVVSAASLMGGASLGPEQALGTFGGGAGQWISQRRGFDREEAKNTTLTGFAGAYGGLFSSTVIVVGLLMEVARPGGQRAAKALASTIVASSVSFGIYFSIAGAVFLDAYQVPRYSFHDWNLLAGFGFGLLAAALVTVLAVIMKLTVALFDRAKLSPVAKSALGGALFGLVGVILPLTLFTGSDQLKTVISDAGALGTGLLVVLVIAKQVTFAISVGSGFVGGPIFPALFVGGTAGVAVHQLASGIPLGLAFTCLLAAVPGALVAAPFSMVLLAAFMTQIGALQTAPILIAVMTSYLTMEGVKYAVSRRAVRRSTADRATTSAPAPASVPH